MSDNEPSSADALWQIIDEFLAAFRQGKRPSIETFAKRYPELADQIRDMLPALVLMEKAKSAAGDSGQQRPAGTAAAAMPLQQLGDYQILREVGRGGMGFVYEAQQLSLGRHVAIKVLPSHSLLDPRQLGRFQREAKSAARLHHTNIVPVFGVGEQDGLHYYVMQFIQGLGLDSVLDELRRLRQPANKPPTAPDKAQRRMSNVTRDVSAVHVAHAMLSGDFTAAAESGPGEPPFRQEPPRAPDVSASIHLPGQSETSTLTESGQQYWQSVARIGVQVADALAYAASQGIQHRDIKPSNLLLDESGNVWITDFGLAKADTDGDNLTHTGDIVGTLRYMAPERFNGLGDVRSDVYSLGLTLYEMLALRPAFDEGDRNRLLKQVMHDEPVRPRKLNPGVPRDLETVVLKAIARDPAHRYQSPAEMAQDLKRVVEDRPVRARRISEPERLWRWCRRNPLPASLLAGIVLVFLGGFAGVFWQWRAAEQARVVAEKARGAAQEKEQEALQSERRAEKARTEADENRDLLQVERDQARHKLYFAEMTLAGIAAEAPAGLGRVSELLARWGPAALGADLRGWEWYYLDSQARQAALTLRGHVGPVRAVAYTRDGTRLATGGDDTTIRIWDTATGREIACLRGHTAAVNGVAWSPDRDRLATVSKDGTARIWDVTLRQELRRLGDPGRPVSAVAWRPDGKQVATTGRDHRVHVWDADTGRERIGPHVSDGWGMALAWSPDGSKLACGSWDFVARVIDAETGAVLATLPGHAGGVLGVSWSPSGDRLATASWDKTVRVWDLHTAKESAVLSEAEYYLHAVCWSPDGKQIAAGGGNRAVQIWNADTRKAAAVLRGNQSDVTALAWSPDGGALAATSGEGFTRVWDVRPGSAIAPGPVQPPWTQTKFSPDGRKIAVRGKDNLIRISAAATGALLQTLDGVAGTPWQTQWSPDGTRIACSGSGWTLAVWDVQTGKRLLLSDTKLGHRHFALAWSPAGDRVATGSDGGSIIVWDASTGEKMLQIQCDTEVWGLSWSPDARQIAAAQWDGLASIWDAATGAKELTFRGHSGRVISIEWSPDGKRVASGSYDRTVKVWDPATGQETLTLRGHAATVRGIHWHPDGCRLATRDELDTLLIWDATPAFLGARSATTLRELDDRIGRDAADTTARRLRAEVLARQGDWDAAAVDFAELARLTASAAAVYPAGWWTLAGPPDRPPSFPPSAEAAPARWLAPASDPNGFVALPGDGTTAISRLYAPGPTMVALDIGPAPPDRLWLDEKAIAGPGPILIELHEGWHSLAVRGGPSELFVRWREVEAQKQ